MTNIVQLAGYVPEPYIKDQVLAAARAAPQPFILREITAAVGLPAYVVNRVLSRCVKQGILSRRKVIMTYPGFTGKGPCEPRWIPGGRKRRVWLYSLVETAG